MVFRQVGDDHFEGVQHGQGAGGGEVQVPPHVVVQDVQRQLPARAGDPNLPAEVVHALRTTHTHLAALVIAVLTHSPGCDPTLMLAYIAAYI